MFLRIWRAVTVLLVALLQGLAFAHVLEQPAKMQYDGPLYVMLQQTLYRQWGPPFVGGLLEPAAIVATLLLAWLMRGERRARWLAGLAAGALLLAFPVVFFALVAPANQAFIAAPPGVVPVDWEAWRSRWEIGHTLRFWLQFFALALLVHAVQSQARSEPAAA